MNIDDSVLEQVKQLAQASGVSLSKAATNLLRQGLIAPCPTHRRNGFVVFNTAGGRKKTFEEIKKVMDSEGF